MVKDNAIAANAALGNYNRQYVGARYVPKFFENPNGTTEWLGNIPYDALTIVTYLGNSYTSKIPVPPGIGNPSLNPTYWALTGNFNTQLYQIYEELQKLSGLPDQVNDALEIGSSAYSLATTKISDVSLTSRQVPLTISNVANNYGDISVYAYQSGACLFVHISFNINKGIVVPMNTKLIDNLPVKTPNYGYTVAGAGTNGENKRFLVNASGLSTLGELNYGQIFEFDMALPMNYYPWEPNLNYLVPYIYNRRVYSNKGTNPDGTAWYVGINAGAKTRSASVDFIFDNRGALGGTLALIMSPKGAAGNNILDKSIHLILRPNYVSVELLSRETGQQHADWLIPVTNFTTPLRCDGTTVNHLEMTVSENSIRVIVNGSLYTGTTEFNLADFYGNYAIFEFFSIGDRAIYLMPIITKFEVVTSAKTFSDNFNRENGALTTMPDGTPYIITTNNI